MNKVSIKNGDELSTFGQLTSSPKGGAGQGEMELTKTVTPLELDDRLDERWLNIYVEPKHRKVTLSTKS
jgi:hypothetical protein